MRYFSEETVMDILNKIEKENGHSVALSFPNFSELKSINIPSKYGRLIDADELYKVVSSMDKCSMSKVLEYILDAPTILEASNKTETPRKARICPHYQGVCGLDEDIVCYQSSSYEMCVKYREAGKGNLGVGNVALYELEDIIASLRRFKFKYAQGNSHILSDTFIEIFMKLEHIRKTLK